MLAPEKLCPLLRVTGLGKTYMQGRWWEQRLDVKALDQIDLTIDAGKTLAVVGRSGSGKSTLAMCVALLNKPDSGEIWFEGRNVLGLTSGQIASLRPRIQIVLQDSSSALPPHFTLNKIIEEPLTVQSRCPASERKAIALELMERVGLPSSWRDRFPHQLSAGQRQRLAVARSLVLHPRLVILDEPFAGLDLSNRGQLVNLLLELQAERSLAYLYISHDLDLVRHFADSVMVLDQGKIVDRISNPALSDDSKPDWTQTSIHLNPEALDSSDRAAHSVKGPLRYVTGRLIQALVLLLVVSLLSFLFLDLAPGDYFQAMRLNPQISGSVVARLRVEYGLDRPLPIRYGRWLMSVVHGDFGYSLAYGSPVGPLLWDRARNTVLLTGTALLTSWPVALLLGILCADLRGGVLDRGLELGTSFLLAVPELLLGLCLLALAVRTGCFPAGGMVSPGFDNFSGGKKIQDIILHFVLPVLVLTLGSAPVLFRHVRSAMAGVLDSPYIRSARGHGVGRYRVLIRHALPAAINPLVSLFGFSVASLLSASLLTEVIMSWPGLGPLLLEAVMGHDVYVIVGAVTLSTLLLIASATATDLFLFAADPRIRSESLR